jgi:hypothetical protein
MAKLAKPRVQHLARYFGILAILCLAGYSLTPLSYPFLFFLAPAYFLTYLLRTHGGFLVGLLPNEPVFNNFFLFVPLTIIYFGLVGFQLKNLLNERGFIRIIVLIIFVGFLFCIHAFTFKEVSLYWEGSSKLTRLH